jgi:hypothetical protein
MNSNEETRRREKIRIIKIENLSGGGSTQIFEVLYFRNDGIKKYHPQLENLF